MKLINNINTYLEETIITKRKLTKKVEKRDEKIKQYEKEIKITTERMEKWKATARALNKELEELKAIYTDLKLNSIDEIEKLTRKVKRLENRIKKEKK